MKNENKWNFLEHTADIKFQAFGKTIEKAFENSALAMFNSMCDEKINPKKNIKIKIEGNNLESLLYNFLEELLFLLDTKNFFLSKIKKLKIKDNKLSGEVFGDNAKNYKIHADIKAVTYNEMFIKFNEKDKRWTNQVVLDA